MITVLCISFTGSVTGEGDDLEVDFLQPCATAGSYRRPSVRDVASVAQQWVVTAGPQSVMSPRWRNSG